MQKRIILVVDGGYARRLLLKPAAVTPVTIIGRLRFDAALYRPVQKVKERGRGRPRKYDLKLPPLSRVARAKGYCSYKLKLSGRVREIRVKVVTAVWKPAGGLITVLIVQWPRAKKPRCFFCTDVNCSVEFVLEKVAARWARETAFRDMKYHLGFGDYLCRKEKAV